MRYARIENGRVAEIIDVDGDIEGRYHPDLLFVAAPDGVAENDQYDGVAFSKPAAPKRDVQGEIDALERASLTNRGARELQLQIMRKEGAELGLQTDEAVAAKVPYFRKLKALDDQIRALRALL